MKHFMTGFALVLVLSLSSMTARATILGFESITDNLASDAAIGEAQLFVDVTDAGGGLVSFLFSNIGPNPSSITDVYFDDGSLLAIAQLIDADDGTGGDPGVDFSPLASPPNLPGGQEADPPFETTQGFSADSDAPATPLKGVNPGETLEILFSLQSGQTFTDVVAELASGALRIGTHVQAFESGGSESFVNHPGTGVAEPGSMVLFTLGILGLAAGVSRRRFLESPR